jgi:RNA polymerase sigma-70 factor, ECF subfamily
MDEQTLIQGLLKGDNHAFRELVALYQDRVYHTVFSFIQHEEDSLDLSQDVFIEIFQSVKHFRKESSLSTWIYRIAVNKALNHIRRKNKSSFIGSMQGIFSTQKENIKPEPADGMKHPHETLENKELAIQLKRAVASLPKNQRIAFVLHKYEDLPYKEISKIMDISLSSVESLIFRARKGLQEKLLDYYKQ